MARWLTLKATLELNVQVGMPVQLLPAVANLDSYSLLAY
jgi:hypothetical protein